MSVFTFSELNDLACSSGEFELWQLTRVQVCELDILYCSRIDQTSAFWLPPLSLSLSLYFGPMFSHEPRGPSGKPPCVLVTAQ